MLRLPVKIILICASIVLIILGSHGLYVRFSRWDVILGSGTPDMLFLSFKLPVDFLSEQVYWMSNKGFQSLFIPAVFVVVGLIVGGWGLRIGVRSNILRKLHLW